MSAAEATPPMPSPPNTVSTTTPQPPAIVRSAQSLHSDRPSEPFAESGAATSGPAAVLPLHVGDVVSLTKAEHTTRNTSAPTTLAKPDQVVTAMEPAISPALPEPQKHTTSAPAPTGQRRELSALASLQELRRDAAREESSKSSNSATAQRTSPMLHPHHAPAKGIGAVASAAGSLFGSAARFFSSSGASAHTGVGAADASAHQHIQGRQQPGATRSTRTASAPLRPSGSLLSALRWGAAAPSATRPTEHSPEQPSGTARHQHVARTRASTAAELGQEDSLNPFGASPVTAKPPSTSAAGTPPNPPSSPKPRTRKAQGAALVLDNYVPAGTAPGSPRVATGEAAPGGNRARLAQLGALQDAAQPEQEHGTRGGDVEHTSLHDATLAAAAPEVHVDTASTAAQGVGATRPPKAQSARAAGTSTSALATTDTHGPHTGGVTVPAAQHRGGTAKAQAAHVPPPARPKSGPATRRLPLPVVAAHIATQLQAIDACIPQPQWRALAEASGFLNALAVAAHCMRQRLQQHMAQRCPWAKVDILSGRQGKYCTLTHGKHKSVQILPRFVFDTCVEEMSTTGGFVSFTTTRDFFKGTASGTIRSEAHSPDHSRPRTARVGFSEEQLLGEGDTARHSLHSANAAVRCVMQCLLELHGMLSGCPASQTALYDPDTTTALQQDSPRSANSASSALSRRSLSADTEARPPLPYAAPTPERRIVYANNPFGVPGESSKLMPRTGVDLGSAEPALGAGSAGAAVPVGLPKPPVAVPSSSDLASLGSAEWVNLSRAGSDGGDSVLGGTPARRSATAVSAVSDDLAPPSRYVRPPPSLLQPADGAGMLASDASDSPSPHASALAAPGVTHGMPYPMDALSGTLQLHLPPQSYAAASKGTPSFTISLKMRRAAAGTSAFARPDGEPEAVFAERMHRLGAEYLAAARLPECDAVWAQWNLGASMLAVNCRWLMRQLCQRCPWYDLVDEGGDGEGSCSSSSDGASVISATSPLSCGSSDK